MAMRRIVCFVFLLACSSKPAVKSSDPCAAYAARSAEVMAPKPSSKNPMIKYVRPELVAAVAAGLETLCRDKLPADHAACVARSTTSQEADLCPLPLDDGARDEVRAELTRIMQSAVDHAMTFPATQAECDATAAEMAAGMASVARAGTTPPDGAAISSLCRKDRWDAAYVRCVAAVKSSPECRSTPIVQDGIRALLGAPPVAR
jgi:hypothetical protein